MLRKTIELATPGTRLSVAQGQLVIERPGEEKSTRPMEDLGVVIIDDVRASYTQAALLALLEAGATVLVSGRDHLPAGMMLPLDAHHAQTERHRAQVSASAPARKRIWQALVRGKIRQQAAVLQHFTGGEHGLVRLAERVRSGDPDNLEAQAAQRYWPRLFGERFRRADSANAVNGLLNYGYAVLRSALARAIVAAGLIPSLGVQHRHARNPFCLADDLFEPYRPFVDWRVRLLQQERKGEALTPSEQPVRAALLSLLNETISLGVRREPLLLAMHTSAHSLCRALTAGEKDLLLPQGLPFALAPSAPAR